jgi:hypothetical protein
VVEACAFCRACHGAPLSELSTTTDYLDDGIELPTERSER